MTSRTTVLPELTKRALQRAFEQLWEAERILPTSFAISDQDYEPLSYDLAPPLSEESIQLMRQLRFTEAEIAEYDKSEKRKHIIAVVNYVNMSYPTLRRDTTLPHGTITIEWNEKETSAVC